jgi:pimeloyl-ACP methyl ester carboxylesterase
MSTEVEAKWETIGPPPFGLFAREHVRAVSELAGFAARRRLLATVPRGDGHAVLVLPGLLAGDFSTAPLRRFLRSLGYDARGWKLGVNLGPTSELREALVARLTRLAERHGRRVSLIGWSLGGIYARELARAHPDRVRLVITLATPFRDISAALRRPLPLPVTSIYSRTDGIVHWQGCLEQEGPQSENVEVRCSHTGMGFHAETLAIVADRLAQREGAWRPYRPEATP